MFTWSPKSREPADPNDSFDRARARLVGDAERVVETACALVVLKGDKAIKLKKPVNYGYLDFSTAEKRRWAIERELTLNRRTAPDVYLGLDQVEGETVLIMRRFDEGALLAAAPDQVDGVMAETLGRTIARFHAAAALAPQGGGAANIDYAAKSNARLIASFSSRLGAEKTAQLEQATARALAAQTPLLDARREQGFSRRAHGDLHLGNIFVEDGKPVLFDCVEFSDLLTDIDILFDLAFLVMDLWFRAQCEAANRVLNAWLDETARSFGEAVWEGLAALPLFLSIRAGVRCHVACNAGVFDEARRYLDAAIELIEPATPTLTSVGGLSGSGKTTWARRRAPELGAAPGAVILRSDEVRKRLWGAGATEPLPPEAYAPEVGVRAYELMLDEARTCLNAGRAIILDAAFLSPQEREAARTLGREAGVPFDGVWLDAAPDELRRRIATRIGDASDASLPVLERQLARDLGPIGWRREAG